MVLISKENVTNLVCVISKEFFFTCIYELVCRIESTVHISLYVQSVCLLQYHKNGS